MRVTLTLMRIQAPGVLCPADHVREWYNGSIVAFQAIDPGSTPGSRNFFLLFVTIYLTNSTTL